MRYHSEVHSGLGLLGSSRFDGCFDCLISGVVHFTWQEERVHVCQKIAEMITTVVLGIEKYRIQKAVLGN